MNGDELAQVGAELRRTVLGSAHAERTGAGRAPFRAPFTDYVTRSAWGQVWARPGLDLRTRSCLTIALLAALRCETELAQHVEAAIGLGVTHTEIQEIMLHTAVYAGAPAANAAFTVAERVLDALPDAQPDSLPDTHPDDPADGAAVGHDATTDDGDDGDATTSDDVAAST